MEWIIHSIFQTYKSPAAHLGLISKWYPPPPLPRGGERHPHHWSSWIHVRRGRVNCWHVWNPCHLVILLLYLRNNAEIMITEMPHSHVSSHFHLGHLHKVHNWTMRKTLFFARLALSWRRKKIFSWELQKKPQPRRHPPVVPEYSLLCREVHYNQQELYRIRLHDQNNNINKKKNDLSGILSTIARLNVIALVHIRLTIPLGQISRIPETQWPHTLFVDIEPLTYVVAWFFSGVSGIPETVSIPCRSRSGS